MSIFFTSDEHYGHANIIKYCNRPFAGVEDMTRGLIERHNAVVKDGDVVWHLGDFSMSEKYVPVVLPQLRGTHHLVFGNHDKCYAYRTERVAAAQRYIAHGFVSVQKTAEVGGFLLDHMPYVSDSRHDDQYNEWLPADHGRWLLHGHVHTEWKARDRMINVGVDVWDYAPVRIEALVRLMAGES